jgi:hypothetical protein
LYDSQIYVITGYARKEIDMGKSTGNGGSFENFAASIDHAVIDTESGVTVSGTTYVPKTLYERPHKERDVNASRLLVRTNESMRNLEPLLPDAVHKILEKPGTSDQLRTGNVIFVMHSNFYGSSISGDVHQPSLQFVEEWNQIKNSVDLSRLHSEIETAIGLLVKNAKEGDHYTDVASLTFARDELKKADGPAMLKHLRSVGKFGLDIIKSMGSAILVKLIMGP